MIQNLWKCFQIEVCKVVLVGLHNISEKRKSKMYFEIIKKQNDMHRVVWKKCFTNTFQLILLYYNLSRYTLTLIQIEYIQDNI